MFRRTASIPVAVLVGTMALAGCGRDAGTGASETADPIASGKASGTITMWAQGAEGEALPALVEDFEAANPGVHVNITAIPWDAAHSKYQTAIAGGTTPDVAQLGTTWMADFADALDPTPTEVDTSDMFAGAKSATVVNDTTVGVPWYVDARVVYYRTDLAAQAGYNAPPQNWDDLKAMAEAYQTKAGAQWGISLGTPGGTDAFQSALPFAWSNGASLTNPDGTEWTLDTPEMIEALEYYQSFFAEGIADESLSTSVGAIESAFVSGDTPMFIGSPAEIGLLNEAGGAGFSGKYAVARIPKQVSSTSFVGGSDLAVFKESTNRDAAWKLVQWLSQPDTQTAFYKSTGDLPSVQSAWDDPSLSGDKKLVVFRAQLSDAKSPPANTGWTQVSAAGDTQLERIVKSGTDPASAMEEMQSTADGIGTGN